MKNLITTINECLVATKKHGQWMVFIKLFLGTYLCQEPLGKCYKKSRVS